MPPRRRASGLTDEEVARLRDQLAEGRRPRVALSGPQFEAGASGSVIRIGDPATDGADFLTVRVKVNGVTDELAFAPSELSTGRPRTKAAEPGRPASARTRRGPASPASAPSGAAAAPSGAAPSGTAPSGTAPTARTTPSDSTSAGTAADRTAPSGAASSGAASSGAASSAPSRTAAAKKAAQPASRPAQPKPATAATGTPPAPAARGGSAGRRRRAPAAPTVSVTISSSGAAWSVTASRGARTIVKNAPITPGAVTALADLLGQPGVSEAVAEINEAAREQARQRAEQLRAELSDLEAVLATHRSPR